jgi:hypothetical protein
MSRGATLRLRLIKTALRLIGLMIAVTVIDARAVLAYGFTLLSNGGHPLITGQGVVEIAWWLSGAAGAILLLLVHRTARWAVLAFFALGLVGTWVMWIPFLWGFVETAGSAMARFAIIQGANLVVLTLVFLLWARMRGAIEVGPTAPQEGGTRGQ